MGVVNDFFYFDSNFVAVFEVPYDYGMVFAAAEDSTRVHVSIVGDDHSLGNIGPLSGFDVFMPHITTFCH